MKYASLLAAVALVLVANAIALVHAARNRSGPVDAEVTLTDRELSYHRDQDDSSVALRLRWVDPGGRFYAPELTPEDVASAIWLDQSKLQELGFECSVAPSDRKASSFYSRQSARTGFAALEYDGASWQSWLEKMKPDYRGIPQSRLMVIDAGRDAAALRSRHPDRRRVLIVPAIVRISLVHAQRAAVGREARPARLTGYVQDVPSLIHVPQPFNGGIRDLRQTVRDQKSETPLYRVRLRYGSLLEPWVTGVEIMER